MFKAPNAFRVRAGSMATDDSFGNNGLFMVATNSGADVLRIIASDGAGWEHVSVSLATRCPTWEEMCDVKGLFWEPEDCVAQLHPPQSQYVNCHPFCLHLWRPANGSFFPLPPSCLVGPVTPS